MKRNRACGDYLFIWQKILTYFKTSAPLFKWLTMNEKLNIYLTKVTPDKLIKTEMTNCTKMVKLMSW